MKHLHAQTYKTLTKETEDDETIYQFIEKARNTTCQIILNDGNFFGFFVEFLYKNNNLFLNILLTCECILTQDITFSDKKIKIKVDDAVKNIPLNNREKISNKEMNYSCIKILEQHEINGFYYFR